ncbi:MAG TPA: hypothetical protein PK961_10220 [bacterium]|nr:hypothetical protein [bacterium]
MINRATLTLAILLMFIAVGLMACEDLKEEINENTKQTQNFAFELTDGWVPLMSVEAADVVVNTVCGFDPVSINTIISATDYADMWEDVKGHIDEVKIKQLGYRLSENTATEAGAVKLYVISGEKPAAKAVPQEVIEELLDDPQLLYIADQNDLNESDLIASIPINPGQDIDDWTDVDWATGGESSLEEMLIDFEQEFTFCLMMDSTPVQVGSISDLNPTVYMKLQSDVDIVFVPLD